MLNRRLHKFGTLLGLFAIWLTALAPTISQAFVAHQRASVEAVLGVECAAHVLAIEHATADADHATHSHDALGHMGACAYCGFFAHLPVVPGTAPVVAPVMGSAPAPYAAPVIEPPRIGHLFSAQPRAPPVVS